MQVFKALQTLGRLAQNQESKELIIQYKVFKVIINCFLREEPHIAREAANALANLLESPQSKFTSYYR